MGAASLAGKGILGTAARYSTEMALMQSGDEISKMITQDPDQSLQTAVANIGLAGLMGAAGGAALGAVSPLWKATVGSKLGNFAEDFKGRLGWHAANPNPAETVTNELSSFHGAMTNLADDVYGAQGLKAQEIAKVMPEFSEKMTMQGQEIASQVKDQLQTMEAKPEVYSPRLTAKLQTDYDRFVNSLTEAGQKPEEIFNAIQDLKQTVQGYSKFDRFIKPVDEAYDFVHDMKPLAFNLRQSLEDPSVWGKAADRQTAINKAFTAYKPALEDFQKRFTTKLADGTVQVDPGKVQTYINQVGKPTSALKQGMLKDFINASQKYANTIAETHANLGLENPFAHEGLAATQDTLGKLTPGMKAADVLVDAGMKKLAGTAVGGAIGSAAGGALGHPYLGFLVGEHALGPFLNSVMPALIKPMLESAASNSGVKAASDYGMQVVKGLKLVSKASKAVFATGAEVLPRHLAVDDAKLSKLDSRLQELQEHPDQMMNTAGELGHYLPDHATSAAKTTANAVQYLNSLRPSTTKASPLDSEPVVSAQQKHEFNRALEIAQNPLIVLSNIKDGTLTPQDVKHFATLYPALYKATEQQLVHEMTEHMAKGEEVPYTTRLGLSMFAGTPLDSTMSPMAIIAAQPKPPMPQGPMAAPKGQKNASGKGLNKVATMDQTPQQARQAYRGGRP